MTIDTDSTSITSSGTMPEGEEFKRLIDRRNRRGAVGRRIFQTSLVVAIVALSALMVNIINDVFGLVTIENEIDPEQLVVQLNEHKMLSAPETVSGEDDDALAKGVAASPYAVGIFGYAYYQNRAQELRSLAIDEMEPSAETVASGDYPLARPLFLYSASKIIAERPQVGTFLNYFLANINAVVEGAAGSTTVIESVGYFPLSDEELAEQQARLEGTGIPTDPASVDGDVRIGGSSTVYPLTVEMAQRFGEAGFGGEATVASTGTKEGFRALCQERTVDIADASRPIQRQEAAVCKKYKLTPIELRIGADALAVAVSSQNDFLAGVTGEQLQQIFTEATAWSEIDPAWPNEPILRYIPGGDSGTLDFFVAHVFDQELPELPAEDLIWLIETNVSAGVLNKLNAEQPLAERSQSELYDLVMENVVQPQVVASWKLFESVLRRGEIEVEVAEKHPDAELTWKSWISREFLSSTQSSDPAQAGVRTALLGSLWVILITGLVAVPVGIGAAVYLEEYAGKSRINHIIQINIDNLAGVPSIIYGILGLAVFVRFLEPITSGTAFGVSDPTTANGRTILSAALTLALLILPLIIISAQEAIRAVPSSLREAGYGLGATKWQVVRSHVLPAALPGIMTGTILAISRAAGETAPLIVVGASTFITVDPTGPFSKFTVVPMQIYQWTSRPQPEFKHIAAAASIVLLVMVFMLNTTAIYLRNRSSKRF